MYVYDFNGFDKGLKLSSYYGTNTQEYRCKFCNRCIEGTPNGSKLSKLIDMENSTCIGR